jgi:Flp pilus assembly protein TadG
MSGSPRVDTAGGQALVEFAIVLPVVFLLILATLDFGRAVFVYNALSEASRQGARVAIVHQNAGAVAQTAVDHAPTAGLATGDVSVCFKSPTTLERDCSSSTDECQPLRPGCLAIVTSALNYAPLTPFVTDLVGPIVLSSTSIAPLEYVCVETTCP